MKKLFLILFFFVNIYSLYSQNYDLVVFNNGDSIACRIDSITSRDIFFEMRVEENWVHTLNARENIDEYSYNSVDMSKFYFEKSSSRIHSRKVFAGDYHSNMYLFAPSSFSLKQHENYYTTYYGLIHDFQFGITDRFTLRAGTDIMFSPFYILPTYTFSLNANSALAVGDLFLVFLNEFTANLVYGTYTYGTKQNNVSLGVGLWSPGISNFSENKSLAFTLAGQRQLSYDTYLTSEIYYFKLFGNHVAINRTTRAEVQYQTYDDMFFGFTGLRFDGKNKRLNSWRFSLLCVLQREGPAPEEYKEWDNVDEGEITFFAFPIVSYSRMFGPNFRK